MDDEEGRRGRKRKISINHCQDVLIPFKSRISTDDGKHLVPPSDPIWNEVLLALGGNKKNAHSIYSYVSCNHDSIRTFLWPQYRKNTRKSNCPRKVYVDADHSEEPPFNFTLDSTTDLKKIHDFQIEIATTEFDEVLENISTNEDSCKRKGSNLNKPQWKCKKDEWKELFHRNLYSGSRLLCEFVFKHHWIDSSKSKAVFIGSCKCNAEIFCEGAINDEISKIKIRIIEKDNPLCGKRLFPKTPETVTCEIPNGDDVSLPDIPENEQLLPESITFEEDNDLSGLHDNPLIAISLLKSLRMENEIQIVGSNKVYIPYYTRHQKTMYTGLSDKNKLCLHIMSIENIIKPITRGNNRKSAPLTLHLAMTQTPLRIISLGQMIAESQTPLPVYSWFMDWMEGGGLRNPDEVITNGSEYIVEGCIRGLTQYRTVNSYADSFLLGDNFPKCYIRIDAIKYVSTYESLLKDLNHDGKDIYRSILLLLTTCQSLKKAGVIIETILTIAQSQYDGLDAENRISGYALEKEVMELLRNTDISQFHSENSLNISGPPIDTDVKDFKICDKNRHSSHFSAWAEAHATIVKQRIDSFSKSKNQFKTKVNRFYCPELADKLLNDMQWLPLLSCITRGYFNYGNVPALSTAVRVETMRTQSILMNDIPLPVRCDILIERHKSHIDGDQHTMMSDTADDSEDEIYRKHCDDSNTTEDSQCNNIIPTSESRHSSKRLKEDILVSTVEPSSMSHSENLEIIKPQSRTRYGRKINLICRKCQSGDINKTRLKCTICKTPIHQENTCSMVVSSEPDEPGGGRICIKCSKKPNYKMLYESSVYENWGNLATIHDNENERENSNFQCSKIPILVTPGNKIKLNEIYYHQKRIVIKNACSFDALLQVMLCVTTISSNFHESLENYCAGNQFIKLVQEIKRRGINDDVFIRRYEILSQHFSSVSEKESAMMVDCLTTVAEMIEKICPNLRCFEKHTTCSNNCPRITEASLYYSIPLSIWLNHQIEYYITGHSSSSCIKDGCLGKLIETMNVIDNFMLFEITSDNLKENKVKLAALPQSIKLSTAMEQFHLRGVIELILPPQVQISETGFAPSNEPVGHYTVYVKYKDNWMNYNDNNVCKCKSSRKILPVMVLYTR